MVVTAPCQGSTRQGQDLCRSSRESSSLSPTSLSPEELMMSSAPGVIHFAGGDFGLWEGEVTSEFCLSCNRLGDQFSDSKREGESSGLRNMVTISS